MEGDDLGTLDGYFIGGSDYWHRIIIRRDGLADNKAKEIDIIRYSK